MACLILPRVSRAKEVMWASLSSGRIICKPACKPGSVPGRKGSATVISLAGRLPGRSSGLPGSHNGPDQPCFPIWPCSQWGLPSQPVARLLVGSYPAFSPLPRGDCYPPKAVCFLLHFPGPGRTRPPWTVGVTHHRVLWSPDFPLPGKSQAATVRPARRPSYYTLETRE